MVAISSHMIFLFGPKWDDDNLHPWQYCTIMDRWSCLKENGEELPQLPSVRWCGAACFFNGFVYGFGGMNERSKRLYHIDRLDTYELLQWERIECEYKDLLYRLYPCVSALNETEIILFGGRKSGMYLDDAVVFSTETMQVRPVLEGKFAFKNPGHTAIQADINCVFALVEDENAEGHVVQVKKDAESGEYSLTN